LTTVCETPDLLTVEEAARIMRYSRTTAYKEARLYIASGGRAGLPVMRVAGLLRVSRVRLEEMIGGPVHLPPPKARRPKDHADVVDLRDHRPSEPSKRGSRQQAANEPVQLPIDIG
jgi:hypothetical protein